MTWWRDAACRGMDTNLFFPERGDDEAVRRAKAICATCPVKAECLDEALAAGAEPGGIWGGTCGRERRRMRIGRPRGPKPIAEHGTQSAYVRGCRCDLCRAANTAAAQRRRASA